MNIGEGLPTTEEDKVPQRQSRFLSMPRVAIVAGAALAAAAILGISYFTTNKENTSNISHSYNASRLEQLATTNTLPISGEETPIKINGYQTDEILIPRIINGVREDIPYRAIPLPSEKTIQPLGKEPLNRDTILPYILVPAETSKDEIKRLFENTTPLEFVSEKPGEKLYGLANMTYGIVNVTFEGNSFTINSDNELKREEFVYNQTPLEENILPGKERLTQTRRIKPSEEKIDTVRIGNSSYQTFVYDKEKNPVFLQRVFYSSPSKELVPKVEIIRDQGMKHTERSLEGYLYAPVFAQVVDVPSQKPIISEREESKIYGPK